MAHSPISYFEAVRMHWNIKIGFQRYIDYLTLLVPLLVLDSHFEMIRQTAKHAGIIIVTNQYEWAWHHNQILRVRAIWAIGCEIAWYGGTFSGRSQAIVVSVLSQVEVMWEIPQSPGLTHVKNLQLQGYISDLHWSGLNTALVCRCHGLRFRCQQSGTHAVVLGSHFLKHGPFKWACQGGLCTF